MQSEAWEIFQAPLALLRPGNNQGPGRSEHMHLIRLSCAISVISHLMAPRLFNSIAPHYDQLNALLSLGQHWFWKQQTAKASGAVPGHKVLDVCCGSGDIAILLSKLVGPRGMVVGLDFASSMLEDAARREERGRLPIPGLPATPISWAQGDATALPFSNDEFDAATMGYGLR